MRPLTIAWMALLLALGLTAQAQAKNDVKDLQRDLRKAARNPEANADEAVKIIGQIGAIGGKDAMEALYEAGKTIALVPKIYDAVLAQLPNMDGVVPYVMDRYKRIKSEADFRERVFIADVCSRAPGKAGLEALITILEDDSPFVQGVAVKGLEKSMNHDAIEPLIKLLEKLTKHRKDILYYQVRDALFNLTAQDFDSIDDWWNWWKPNAASFDPKKVDEKSKTGVRRKRRGKDPDFFGVPVHSKNVLFVIDTSGSMKYVHKDDIPGLAHADGSDRGQGKGGGQMSRENQKLAQFWTRMEMAKRELRKVVKRMQHDAIFNMVRFDTTVSTFKRNGVIANPGNKSSAMKWIDSLRPNGNTNTMDALIQAFHDPKVNTIFFLSDGLPSKDGKTDDPQTPILDRVFAMNRFRKIKINTFGFYPRTMRGQPIDQLEKAKGFLKKLAEATGGTYTDMKVDTRLTPEHPELPPKPEGGSNSSRDENRMEEQLPIPAY